MTLRDTLIEKIYDIIILIDIEDKEYKEMIVDINDTDRNPTEIKRIVIPALYLYSKEVGEVQG